MHTRGAAFPLEPNGDRGAMRSIDRAGRTRRTARFDSVLGFMQALWALEQGLNRRSKAMLRASGVTGPQRLVLLVVARLGPIAPGQLARVLHLHPASVTRLARTMEDRGFLRRRRHPRDRRQLLLEVAPRGRRAAAERAGTVESAVRTALTGASSSEVRAAMRLIGRVAARLGAGSSSGDRVPAGASSSRSGRLRPWY